MNKQLSPSMMCADFFHLGNQLKEFENAGIEYLHIDIMDGVFSDVIRYIITWFKEIGVLFDELF